MGLGFGEWPTVQTLLQDLSAEVKRAFDEIQRRAPCPTGAVLWREGQELSGVYVLHNGRVSVLPFGAKGGQPGARTAADGEILGLSAVICGCRSRDTAQTFGPCDIGFIDREDFIDLLRNHPELAFRLVRVLSQQLCTVFESFRPSPRRS